MQTRSASSHGRGRPGSHKTGELDKREYFEENVERLKTVTNSLAVVNEPSH